MFLGEFSHSIDKKKRISIPTKLRKDVGSLIVITKGPDKCLFLYPIDAWRLIAEKLSKLPLGQADTRNFVRFMLSGAQESDIDSLGRIILPDHLKNYAGISGKAVIVGVYDRIEIWSPERWEDIK